MALEEQERSQELTLYSNPQEAVLFQKLIPKLQIESGLFTDFAIEGIEKNRAYERKTIKDLLASIIDGRIFNQLKELASNAELFEPFVIIEDFWFFDDKTRKFTSINKYFENNPDRELSFYSTLTAFKSFGVGLVWTLDARGTARFLQREDEK